MKLFMVNNVTSKAVVMSLLTSSIQLANILHNSTEKTARNMYSFFGIVQKIKKIPVYVEVYKTFVEF